MVPSSVFSLKDVKLIKESVNGNVDNLIGFCLSCRYKVHSSAHVEVQDVFVCSWLPCYLHNKGDDTLE